jgi:peptide deformylase
MTIRRILRLGDPRLRQVAQPVEAFDTPDLYELIADLVQTMHRAQGAGLAATQIGIARRVMVFGVLATPRYPDAPAVPQTVLINPSYEIMDEQRCGHWEGCLSVPGLRGYVERAASIRYRGYDALGNMIERDAQGFHAAVFQHELDHLDGILFPDRIADRHMLGFEADLREAGLL